MHHTAHRTDADRDAAAAVTTGQQHPSTLALPRALDLPFASELLSHIVARGDQKVLTLDASEVEYASTPCVQILLAAGRRRDATNGSLVIQHASDAFRRAIGDFGLQSEFNNWVA